MAEFRALPGPSPNCEAVLVQIEHCAKTDWELQISTSNKPRKSTIFFFITYEFGSKIARKTSQLSLTF